MKASNLFCVLSVLMMLSFSTGIYAQSKPKAILVQLRSEHKRISYLQETRQRKKVNEMKREAEVVAKVMINDFEDNFSFCPVYYYYDTNYHLILQNKFDGVLMNAEGMPATDIVLSGTDKDYWIAYFGALASQSNNSSLGKGLILTDSQGKNIDQFWRGEYFDIFRPDPKYSYTSKKYDLRYLKSAQKLNDKLKEKYS